MDSFSRKGGDVENGQLYPGMMENPQMRWAFIRKIYVLLCLQLLFSFGVGCVLFFNPTVKHFMMGSPVGWAIILAALILTVISKFFTFFIPPPSSIICSCDSKKKKKNRKTFFMVFLLFNLLFIFFFGVFGVYRNVCLHD